MQHVMKYLAQQPRPLTTLSDQFDNMNSSMKTLWKDLPDTGILQDVLDFARTLELRVTTASEPCPHIKGAQASYFNDYRMIVLRDTLTIGQAGHTLLHEIGHALRNQRHPLAMFRMNINREEMIVEAAASVIEAELFEVVTPTLVEASGLYVAAYALEDEDATKECYLDDRKFTDSVYRLVESFIEKGLVSQSKRPWYVSARGTA